MREATAQTRVQGKVRYLLVRYDLHKLVLVALTQLCENL